MKQSPVMRSLLRAKGKNALAMTYAKSAHINRLYQKPVTQEPRLCHKVGFHGQGEFLGDA